MRALLRNHRSDDELARALARAGFYVERVPDRELALSRLRAGDVAVVDPRLLAGASPAPVAARPPVDPRAVAERSLEELCYARLGALLDRLGAVRLPQLHATVMAEAERALLRLALERTGGLGAAAELLGVHRNTLSKRLEALGLRRREERRSPSRRRRAS